jgi:ABC-type nickel/cobalt efflux system permease component RcnA
MRRRTNERRPLRYRGARLRSEKERPRLSLLIAVVQTTIAVYSAFVVVRAGVVVAEGTRQSGRLVAALVFIALIGLWAGVRAGRRWRAIATVRRATARNGPSGTS